MSYSGSGTFNINTSGQPVVAGTTITSAAFNALTADLATGLSTAICKDGQTTITANIPFNSFKITNLGAGTLTADAARMSQLQSGASQLLTTLTGTDTLTATLLPTLTAYAAGNVFTFVAANTNTTAVTLNIDALGAKAVTRDGSIALVAGDIVAGTTYQVMYDGTRFQLLNCATFTNPTVSGNLTLSGGTANGVAYLNASKVVTTGSALTFDGTTLASSNVKLLSSGSILDGGANAVLTATSGGSVALISNGAYTNGNLTYNALAATGIHVWYGNSVEKMRLDASGNLGIGTTPSYKLDVSATGTISGRVKTSGALNAFYMEDAGTTAGTLYIGSVGNDWRVVTGSNERLRVSSAGNVTINAPSSGTALSMSAASGTTQQEITRLTNSTNSGYLSVAGVGSASAVASWANGSMVSEVVPFGSGNYIISAYTGNLVFQTNARTTQAVLDGSGNLGLGVTPSAWTTLKVMQFTAGNVASYDGGAANRQMHLMNNAYYDGAYKYVATDTSQRFTMVNGQFQWHNAASGTAGTAITFTQAMTLDASGNLTVPAMYGTTVTTPRNVFIDSTGKMGGISSTRASKTNIADLDDVSWLYALNPVTFNYRKRDEEGNYLDECEDETQYGLIAEDTEPHAPDLCIYDAEGKVAGIHYDRMIAPLLKALQDQAAVIEQLTARIEALELGNG